MMPRLPRLYGELRSGSLVNILNFGYNATITAASVSFLTRAWGAEKYGIWVLLFSVPAYLALADFGFSTAATNEIAMAAANGETVRARQIFQTSIFASALLGAATSLLLIAIVVYLGTIYSLVAAQALSACLLVCYSYINIIARAILGGFRGGRHYAEGTFYYDTAQFLEGLLLIACAVVTGSFPIVIATMIGVRLSSLLFLAWRLSVQVRWLVVPFERPSTRVVLAMVPPAASSMLIPLSTAFSLQGVALVTGAVLGPGAAASLAVARTVSRIAHQVLDAVVRAAIPELSATGARGDDSGTASLVRLSIALYVVVGIPSFIIFGCFGKRAIAVWTGGNINPPQLLIALIACSMALHSLWYFGTALLSATNRHTIMAGWVSAISVFTVLLCSILAKQLGLSGIGSAILIGEVACTVRFVIVVKREHIWRSISSSGKALPPGLAGVE